MYICVEDYTENKRYLSLAHSLVSLFKSKTAYLRYSFLVSSLYFCTIPGFLFFHSDVSLRLCLNYLFCRIYLVGLRKTPFVRWFTISRCTLPSLFLDSSSQSYSLSYFSLRPLPSYPSYFGEAHPCFFQPSIFQQWKS